jgi:peptide/nickel transport system substrate-binding protein
MKHIVLLASAALLGLAAFPAQAQSPSTLRIGLQEDPDILDPHEARTFVGRIVFNALCDKLIDTNEKLEIVPRLATSWTVSDEGKTVTFKLREGVKFHDGTPFDAASVKANIERAKTSQTSRRKSEVASVTSVEVVDPLTVAFKLKQADAPLLAQLTDRAGMMLSPASFDKPVGPKPICSGPYKFVERVQNDRIVLERFADHWEKDKYHFDKVTFRTIPDSTVRLANLRSGQLDMLERLAPTDVSSAKATRALKVESTANLGYQGITINTNIRTPIRTADRARTSACRQALSLAIDREGFERRWCSRGSMSR